MAVIFLFLFILGSAGAASVAMYVVITRDNKRKRAEAETLLTRCLPRVPGTNAATQEFVLYLLDKTRNQLSNDQPTMALEDAQRAERVLSWKPSFDQWFLSERGKSVEEAARNYYIRVVLGPKPTWETCPHQAADRNQIRYWALLDEERGMTKTPVQSPATKSR